MIAFFQRYVVGAKYHWRKCFGWALGAWGLSWLVVNSISFLVPTFKEFVVTWNLATLFGFVALAIAVVLYRLPVRTKISVRIPTTNTTVEILFADLFACPGHLAIPVNEYFDGRLGQHVSPNSVHGQFIQKFCEGDRDRFENRVDAALTHRTSSEKQRTIGRNKIYPMGTAAILDAGERKCFLFVVATSDPNTAKAYSNVPMMWVALQELWREVRTYSNGNPINIPLVGSGQSGIGLEPIHLLRLMLLSLLVATRDGEVTKVVRIVLHKSMLDRVDLTELLNEWK